MKLYRIKQDNMANLWYVTHVINDRMSPTGKSLILEQVDEVKGQAYQVRGATFSMHYRDKLVPNGRTMRVDSDCELIDEEERRKRFYNTMLKPKDTKKEKSTQRTIFYKYYDSVTDRIIKDFVDTYDLTTNALDYVSHLKGIDKNLIQIRSIKKI